MWYMLNLKVKMRFAIQIAKYKRISKIKIKIQHVDQENKQKYSSRQMYNVQKKPNHTIVW